MKQIKIITRVYPGYDHGYGGGSGNGHGYESGIGRDEYYVDGYGYGSGVGNGCGSKEGHGGDTRKEKPLKRKWTDKFKNIAKCFFYNSFLLTLKIKTRICQI